MASSTSVLCEDLSLCSICLDVFSQPVTIPCGHNFCKACITKHWDVKGVCECPLCTKTFGSRPVLFINTLISELAAQVRKSAEASCANDDGCHQVSAEPVQVLCDICIGTKHQALKSCLTCLASYCETHLEPHRRLRAWKNHKLISPAENLEKRLCEKHERLLELFCRQDEICMCVLCLKTEHKAHEAAPLEEIYEEKMSQLPEIKREMHEIIRERHQKIQQIRDLVELNKKNAEKEVAESVKVFTTFVALVQRSQAELIEAIGERQKEAEEQGEELIKELEQEIDDLKRRTAKLELLSQSEDHLHFLQSLPSLSTLPHTRDWSEISIDTDWSTESVGRVVSQLEETMDREMNLLPGVMMKRIRRYAVDVTLDPGTAHPDVVVSEDGKQMRFDDLKEPLPKSPERFDVIGCVLGKEGFSSGRVYYEVQVKGSKEWSLGLMKESANRKGTIPGHKFWTLRLKNRNEYSASKTSANLPRQRRQPQKVGVFLDYEKGQICFYDPEIKALLCSFAGCDFTEKIYPVFRNVDTEIPLIITSVDHK